MSQNENEDILLDGKLKTLVRKERDMFAEDDSLSDINIFIISCEGGKKFVSCQFHFFFVFAISNL